MKNPKKEIILGTMYIVWVFIIVVSIPIGIVWLVSGTAHLYWGLIPSGTLGIFIIILLIKSGARETRKTDILLSTILGLISISIIISGVINYQNRLLIIECEGKIDYLCIIEEHKPSDTNGFYATLARSTENKSDYLVILRAHSRASPPGWDGLGFNSVLITDNMENSVSKQFTCKGRGPFWGDEIYVSPNRERSWELLECPISYSAADYDVSKLDIELSYTYAFRLQGQQFENRMARDSFTLEITK